MLRRPPMKSAAIFGRLAQGDINTRESAFDAHERLSPVRLSGFAERTGKGPVACGFVLRVIPPRPEVRARTGSSWAGFCDASVLHEPTTCITMEPLESEQFACPQSCMEIK
jgi:hypothetical protein